MNPPPELRQLRRSTRTNQRLTDEDGPFGVGGELSEPTNVVFLRENSRRSEQFTGNMRTGSTELVEDVMSTPLQTISRDASMKIAAERMREEDVNALFVPGPEAGVVTATDIVGVVAAGNDPTAVRVADVMTAPVERVTTGVDLSEAAAMMTTYGIKHLPVSDNHGDYVGIISSTDLATELV
jgi:CBS domain-containing protein